MELKPLDKCPITRRDFFMLLEHPEEGLVATYGGPYDSYTIPEMGGEPADAFHDRELSHHRYDHDVGGWVEDEVIPLRVIHEDNLITPSPSACKASLSGCKSESPEKVIAAAIERDGGDHDDCCKYYRVPSQGCNCGHDAFIEALAAYQKESE